jgi:hypothetical protein
LHQKEKGDQKDLQEIQEMMAVKVQQVILAQLVLLGL